MTDPTQDALTAALAQPREDGGEAEGWRPEPGDMLIGVVEDVDVGWSDFRGEYPIITIRATEGTQSTNVKPGESVKLHCFHDVLFNRVLTLRPVAGETVGVQFHGKFQHKTKASQTVSRYTFKVQGRSADAGGLYDRMGAARTPRAPQSQAQRAPIPPAQSPAQPLDFGKLGGGAAAEDDDIPF